MIRVVVDFASFRGSGDAYVGIHEPAGEVVERELYVFCVLREIAAEGHLVRRRAGESRVEGEAAAQMMRGHKDTPIGEAFRSVLSKLRKAIKPLEMEMTTLSGAYIDDPEIEYNYTGHKGIIAFLLKALHQRQLLDIRYHAAHNDTVTERTVAPLCFWKSGGELYLIAHCYLRDTPRSFRVDRFVSVKPSAEKHPWPDNFNPVDFIRHSFGPWGGEPKEVVLEFPDYDASYFDDLHVHETQRIDKLKGGGVVLRLKVAPSLHLARWLAGFGGEVRIKEPEELREWVRNLHQKGLIN